MSDEDTVIEAPRPTFKVRQFVEPHILKKDISFSLADLGTAMMEQASTFVHYGSLAASASKQVDDLKMLLEVAESKVYRSLRDDAATAGTKVTEAQLEKSVSVHPKVIQVKRALNEAKQIEALAKVAVEGFRHRKDMLVQQGAQNREEMKGEVSINRRHTEEERIENIKDRLLNRGAKESSVSADL